MASVGLIILYKAGGLLNGVDSLRIYTGRIVGCGSRVTPYDHLIVVYRGVRPLLL